MTRCDTCTRRIPNLTEQCDHITQCDPCADEHGCTECARNKAEDTAAEWAMEIFRG